MVRLKSRFSSARRACWFSRCGFSFFAGNPARRKAGSGPPPARFWEPPSARKAQIQSALWLSPKVIPGAGQRNGERAARKATEAQLLLPPLIMRFRPVGHPRGNSPKRRGTPNDPRPQTCRKSAATTKNPPAFRLRDLVRVASRTHGLLNPILCDEWYGRTHRQKSAETSHFQVFLFPRF